jgi:excisionase family DNA binding protein
MKATDAAPKGRRVDESGYATAEQVGAYLGISRFWVYGLARNKLLTHVKLGRRIVFPWRAVYEFAAARTTRGRIA